MLYHNMLHSITMDVTRRSRHPLLMTILSPIRNGLLNTHPSTRTSLAPQQKIKDKLRAHLRKHRRLGDAKTNFWLLQSLDKLLLSVNLFVVQIRSGTKR